MLRLILIKKIYAIKIIIGGGLLMPMICQPLLLSL